MMTTHPPLNSRWAGLVFLLGCWLLASAGLAADAGPDHDRLDRRGGRSIADTTFQWPSPRQFRRVLLLRDFNTRVVVLGVTCLGLASGTIGTFLLLRKRALTADALSHATLPGIAVAFLIMVSLGDQGKSLPALLLGAFIFGSLAMGCILLIRHTTRLKDDAALGIVLSVFFGLGLALLNIIQKLPTGNAAGLNRFIFGKAAAMLPSDAWAILLAALVIAAVCAMLFKEFSLVCFDPYYARSQGWPVLVLDILLMALVVGVTVIALQAVGLVLAVAMLIIPASAARFWTQRLRNMTIGSAAIGMASGYLGAVISALLPRMPTGPVIVLVCSTCFLFSMIFGIRRGIVTRMVAQLRLNGRVGMQHLLRAMFERCEIAKTTSISAGEPGASRVSREDLLGQRSWSVRRLRKLIGKARRRRLLTQNADDSYSLTHLGVAEARRVVRNHRLWEVYLIHHADIAPSHVDRDADQVEHVLGRDMIDRLEELLVKHFPAMAVPPSPHPLAKASAVRPGEAS